MAALVNDITLTPGAVEVKSGLAFGVPETSGIFGFVQSTLQGTVAFLGAENAPPDRPVSGQLWPRGETLS